jgi:hypothetical protein
MEEPTMFPKMKIAWNVLLVVGAIIGSVIMADFGYAASFTD